MKKFLVLLLAILMVFAIVSCKDEPEQADEPQATEAQGKDNLLSQGAKSGAKAIDHKGFKIVGKYNVAETELVVEVGGKDGIYWLGTDSDDNETIDEYLIITEIDNGDSTYTLKMWDTSESLWVEYVSEESVKEALFGEGGLADQILYCSFGFKDNKFFSALENSGSASKNGRNCTKYTSSFVFDATALGGSKDMKAAEINIYVDKEFAITAAMDFSFTQEFKDFAAKVPGAKPEDFVALSYNATVDLAPAESALPAAYAEALAAL